jgi:hypothetical protein
MGRAVPSKIYMADDRKAGRVRNQRILDEDKPDLVITFPGCKRTAAMMEVARRAGVRGQADRSDVLGVDESFNPMRGELVGTVANQRFNRLSAVAIALVFWRYVVADFETPVSHFAVMVVAGRRLTKDPLVAVLPTTTRPRLASS